MRPFAPRSTPVIRIEHSFVRLTLSGHGARQPLASSRGCDPKRRLFRPPRLEHLHAMAHL
jgi:hypothetical protein